MAIVRKSLAEVRASRPKIDRKKMDATVDADISAHIQSDPDVAPDMADVALPAEPRALRVAAKMTQEQFAALLGVPLGTLRNWEQSRTAPEAGAMALFRLMAKDLPRALELLRN